MRFGLIGNGTISQRHKDAIKHVGGELVWISDPAFVDNHAFINEPLLLYSKNPPDDHLYSKVDYVVICSPTYFHRAQVKQALLRNKKVICEKPLCLPWEPLIDDDRINIVLQLRWIKDLPEKADLIEAVMVRDEAFFKTWKGDPRKAGGNIYEFFIHYIDLAIQLGAAFKGLVTPHGKQKREIVWEESVPGEWKDIAEVRMNSALSKRATFHDLDQMLVHIPGYVKTLSIDIMKIDMQDCYNRMYEDILQGKGVKPKDIFYLTWVLNRCSEEYGYRKSGFDKGINIPKEFLR